MTRAIAIHTTRHSAFFRRLLDRYAGRCEVQIDGVSYLAPDIEALKVSWCTNQKIRCTHEFRLTVGEQLIAGFHDSVDELFVIEEEREWIEQMSKEGLLRLELLPIVDSPSIFTRVRGWIRRTPK